MEAIKCPNCGSEKVQELTEEKYVCLACDNEFLVHNLSKEFHQTDEHIENVHKDLNQKLDDLGQNIKTVSAASGDGDYKQKELLFEAEEELSNQHYATAYYNFKKYASIVPDSYVGYAGMYRAIIQLREMGKADIYDGFDVLKKALACEDCDKNTILTPVMAQYQKMSDEASFGGLKEELQQACQEAGVAQTDMAGDINQLIRMHESRKTEMEGRLAGNRKAEQERVQRYQSLSEQEKADRRKKRYLIAFVPAVVLLLLGIFVFHGIFRILLIAVAVLWAWLASSDTEASPENQFTSDQEAIASEQKQADYWRDKLETVNAKETVQLSDMENIVCRDFAKGRPADELAKDLKIIEEDEQEGFWEVEGNFSTLSLGEIMMPYQKIREFCCNFPNAKYYARGGGYRNFLDDDDKAYLRFFYNADKDFRIIQLRKSEAYALQNLLNKLGAAKAKVEKQEGGLS